MSFKSLSHVFDTFGDRYRRQEQQQLQQLLRSWVKVVGPVVAAQTRPLSIHQGVLRVATASPAWSQNLIFERQRILEKLNPLLPKPLLDIRFSTAQWHSDRGDAPQPDFNTQLWREHPSRLTDVTAPEASRTVPTDPLLAYQQWAKRMQARTQNMALCPKCHCPTPPGELQRWQLCSLCVVKQW